MAMDELSDWCDAAGYDPPEYTSRYFEASVVVAGQKYAVVGSYLDMANEKAAQVALAAIRVDCKYGVLGAEQTNNPII